MQSSDRAVLRERVRTLVLRHALEAALHRVAAVSGAGGDEELTRLELAITASTRRVGTLPADVQLTTLVAVEDAIATIRSAFDGVHARLEAAEAA